MEIRSMFGILWSEDQADHSWKDSHNEGFEYEEIIGF